MAGIMLGYGWCNYLLQIRVSANTIGVLLVNAANNVNVVNAIVEANYGAGIVLASGYQVNLEGNVIEGNKGPAIVAERMYALTIQVRCHGLSPLSVASLSTMDPLMCTVWVCASMHAEQLL